MFSLDLIGDLLKYPMYLICLNHEHKIHQRHGVEIESFKTNVDQREYKVILFVKLIKN